MRHSSSSHSSNPDIAAITCELPVETYLDLFVSVVLVDHSGFPMAIVLFRKKSPVLKSVHSDIDKMLK